MRVIALSALVLPLTHGTPTGDRPLSRTGFAPQRGVRRFIAAELFPADDLEAQAHVISWMSFIVSTIHPARRIGGARAERYVFEGSVERWKEVFEIAEKRLGPQNWVAGRYSIADIHLFRLYWRFVESTPLGLKGDLEQARTALAEAIKIMPEINSITQWRANIPAIKNARYWALLERTVPVGLRRAGFPDE